MTNLSDIIRILPPMKSGNDLLSALEVLPEYSKEQLAHALELLENHSFGKVVKMTGISKSTLVRERRKKQTV